MTASHSMVEYAALISNHLLLVLRHLHFQEPFKIPSLDLLTSPQNIWYCLRHLKYLSVIVSAKVSITPQLHLIKHFILTVY